jgi:hypothetical protein
LLGCDGPESEVQNQLRVALDCHKAIGVADGLILGFFCGLVAFLLPDVGPDFITFNIADFHISDEPGHHLLALLTSGDK